jgi:hypothetical protein
MAISEYNQSIRIGVEDIETQNKEKTTPFSRMQKRGNQVWSRNRKMAFRVIGCRSSRQETSAQTKLFGALTRASVSSNFASAIYIDFWSILLLIYSSHDMQFF